MVDLLDVPEPKGLRKEAQSLREKEGGNWDADSLRVWFRNALPSYLWNHGWKEKAQEEGCSWPKFLRIVSLNKRDIILWLRGSKEWGELLQAIEDTFLEFHVSTP